MIIYIYLNKDKFIYIISKISQKSGSCNNLMNYFVQITASDRIKSC